MNDLTPAERITLACLLLLSASLLVLVCTSVAAWLGLLG